MEAQALPTITTVEAPHHGAGFLRSYVFSTDHKVIGKQYLAVGLLMSLIGGFMAYLIRVELAWPGKPLLGWGFIAPASYLALVTMHGTIMVFFVAMPMLLGAFGNFLIPADGGRERHGLPAPQHAFVLDAHVRRWCCWRRSSFPEGRPPLDGPAIAPLSDNAAYTGNVLGHQSVDHGGGAGVSPRS